MHSLFMASAHTVGVLYVPFHSRRGGCYPRRACLLRKAYPRGASSDESVDSHKPTRAHRRRHDCESKRQDAGTAKANAPTQALSLSDGVLV